MNPFDEDIGDTVLKGLTVLLVIVFFPVLAPGVVVCYGVGKLVEYIERKVAKTG